MRRENANEQIWKLYSESLNAPSDEHVEDEEIHSAGDAVQHHWAATIAHPGLGGENEEFEVYDHSLTKDGVVEEYYVHYHGNLYALPASEVVIIEGKTHPSDEEHGVKPKRKGARPDYPDVDGDGDTHESMEDALKNKKKGKHGHS